MAKDETKKGGKAKPVDQQYTVDPDAFLYKDTSSGYAPGTKWKMADGTVIDPSKVTRLMDGEKTKRPKSSPPPVASGG